MPYDQLLEFGPLGAVLVVVIVLARMAFANGLDISIRLGGKRR